MESKEELIQELHDLNRQYEEAYEENRALLLMIDDAAKGKTTFPSQVNELPAKRANAKRKFNAITDKRRETMDKLHRLYGKGSVDYTV